ncbi:MAG TPA: lipopolysaccharide biosynthesis protein, partial [Coriobacteriia bacterium]|nr:lipopolysaccharide biosynthesis protein [Coriobacteriia bacterium]
MAAATFKEKVTRGMAWNGGATVMTRAFQAIVTIILARLLDPGDFGVVGMTTLVTGFVAMFTELGLVSAIVQADEVAPEQLNTVFWFGSAAGLVSWGLCALLAPTIASFFHMSELALIVPVSAAGMAIGSLGLVHRALLSRRLDFRSVAFADISAAVGFGVVAISGAFAGWGPWSLVAGGLAMITVRTAVVCARASWMPGLRSTWRGFGALFSFGVKTLGVSMLGYMRGNVDYLVIGRFMGAAPLGQYTLAFKIADFPRARITPIFTAVAFPAFSSVRSATDMVRRGYLRGVRLVSLIVFPLLTGAALLAYEIVVVVYGQKWLPA